MDDKKVVLFNILKILFLSIIFYLSVQFENAWGLRLTKLIVTFTVYIIIGLLRSIYFKGKASKYTYLFDIILIYYLEHNSKYLINYFFHSFYIAVLLESSLNLNRRNSLTIGIITVSISLIKYMFLIYYNTNLSNISQMAFFTLLSIFILVISNFAQYNKEEREKKEKLYQELLKAHEKLKEYAKRVEELTVVEERNRIARDLHDTLGHNMTGTIMEIELASHIIDKDTEKAKIMLERAKKSAREGLARIREVVETLKPDKGICKGIDSIKELTDNFSNKTGVKIGLNVKGNIINTNPSVDVTLYRIIQESLTNSVRHGEADSINIYIEYSKSTISFWIRDNGIVSENFEEGFGLKGIRERIKSLGGEVKFIIDNGFITKGFIPLEVDKL